jgi:hypothetical protein
MASGLEGSGSREQDWLLGFFIYPIFLQTYEGFVSGRESPDRAVRDTHPTGHDFVRNKPNFGRTTFSGKHRKCKEL